MKRYELTFILSPEISEQEFQKISEEINNFIISKGGEIEEIKKPTRRRLGYLVKKRAEGLLCVLDFLLEQGKIEELELMLKQKQGVLRHMIIRREKKKPASIRKRIEKTAKPRQKADIMEIDQKIEEMLKE